MAEALSVMPDEIVVQEEEGDKEVKSPEKVESESEEVEVEEPEGEEESEEEKPKPPSPEGDASVKEMRRIAKLLEEDREDRKAARGKEEGKKSKKEELTDEQLIKVIGEYKDNPAVLLQVFKHVAESTALGIKDKTVEEERARTWADQTNSSTMGVLRSEYGKLDAKEQAEMQETLPGLIQNLGLGNHPAGALAAFAIVRMAQLGGKSKLPEADPPKKEGEPKPKGKMDKTRRASESEDTSRRVSQEEKTILKELGIKDPKLYLQFKRGGE